ncbi:hypothetical protein FRC03_009585 [Tulasnella sp. 419]|nr:hypothetical protein FRC03_009585 [Tulasnella sp. 419]
MVAEDHSDHSESKAQNDVESGRSQHSSLTQGYQSGWDTTTTTALQTPQSTSEQVLAVFSTVVESEIESSISRLDLQTSSTTLATYPGDASEPSEDPFASSVAHNERTELKKRKRPQSSDGSTFTKRRSRRESDDDWMQHNDLADGGMNYTIGKMENALPTNASDVGFYKEPKLVPGLGTVDKADDKTRENPPGKEPKKKTPTWAPRQTPSKQSQKSQRSITRKIRVNYKRDNARPRRKASGTGKGPSRLQQALPENDASDDDDDHSNEETSSSTGVPEPEPEPEPEPVTTVPGDAGTVEKYNQFSAEVYAAFIAARGTTSWQLSVLKSTKPLPPRSPVVWSETRQELCEGTPYFKAYHGGIYQSLSIAQGYLLDGFPAPRDIYANNGRLIISHGGGKAVNVKFKMSLRKQAELMVLKDNQDLDDPGSLSLINCYKDRIPVVLLIGSDYALFPYDMRKVGYAVLGWYMVRNFWAEKEPSLEEKGRVVYKNRLKFAFEWLPGQEEPFFAPPPIDSNTNYPPIPYPTCETNHNPEPLDMDIEEPMTMSINDGTSNQLRRKRRKRGPKPKPKPQPKMARAIKPPLARNQNSFTRDVKDGWESKSQMCKVCHKISPQVYTAGWMCLRTDCPRLFLLSNNQIPRPELLQYMTSFLSLRPSQYAGISIPYDVRPGAVADASHFGGYVTDLEFCRAFHCLTCGRLSCKKVLYSWKCANPDCGIEINVPANSKLHTAENPIILCTETEVEKNSGITSQTYHVDKVSDENTMHDVRISTFSLPESRGLIHHIHATPEIRAIADKLFEAYQRSGNTFVRPTVRHRAGSMAMQSQYFAFNAGVHYHYSSYTESLTLEEAPACVREVLDVINERTSLILNDHRKQPFNEVLSVAYLEDQKMSFHTDDEKGLGPIVASFSMGADAWMDFRSTVREKNSKKKRDLRLHLCHVSQHIMIYNAYLSKMVMTCQGDVVVMEGSGVQEHYEHQVTPHAFRIAATARQIYPEHEATLPAAKPKKKGKARAARSSTAAST